VARKRGVPADVVLQDVTIDGIATPRPTVSAQLRAISGIGDKNLGQDGEELIALVKAGRAEALAKAGSGRGDASRRQKCHSNCHGAAQRRAVPKCPVFPGGMN